MQNLNTCEGPISEQCDRFELDILEQLQNKEFVRHKSTIDICHTGHIQEVVCNHCGKGQYWEEDFSVVVNLITEKYEDLVYLFSAILTKSIGNHVCFRIPPEVVAEKGRIRGYMRYIPNRGAGAQS